MQPKPEGEKKQTFFPVSRPKAVRKLAELGIMRALPKVKADDIMQNGRLLSRIMKLENTCTAEMKAVKDGSNLYLQQKPVIQKLLTIFGEITGWLSPDVHLCVGATFCLKIVEASKFDYDPKIKETLEDIIDYYKRGGITPDASYEEAYPITVEAWNSLKILRTGEIVATGEWANAEQS